MDTVETIRVKSSDPESQGPFVVINKTDFDPAVHTEFKGGKSSSKDDETIVKKLSEGLTVAQLRDALEEKNITVPETTTLKADLAALLDATVTEG